VDYRKRRTFLWEHPFFGLTDEYKSQLHELIFDLCHFGHFGYDSVYSMPVQYRTFYIRKLIKVKQDEKSQYDKQSRQSNTSSGDNKKIHRGPAI